MEYYIAQSMLEVRYSAPMMPTPRHYKHQLASTLILTWCM